MKICAVIITHNRIEKLKNCIQSVKKQKYKNFDIVVCDSNSKDGTKEYVLSKASENLKYINSETDNKNLTYTFAVQYISEQNYDWIWFLHDDVEANETSLINLVAATKALSLEHSFFASSIFSEKKKAVNTPTVSEFSIDGYKQSYIALDKNLIRIASSSFCSVLINNKAIKKVGIPNPKHLFGDNSNYLSSLVQFFGAAYLVGSSKVIHQKELEVVKVTDSLKICAVVVTYNRKEMLSKCINSLLQQTYNNYDILVIDNASTDATEEYVKSLSNENLLYLNTGANLGGAGGFYYGLREAYERNYDWIWIMDDDVLPNPTALSELLVTLKLKLKVSFLASAVYSPDGKAMNTPEISKYSTNGYRFWYEHLDKGLVRLGHATFVSLLINAKAIQQCGLPCKDYFIWGDDTEYTMRLIGKYGAAYLVGKSKVIHCRANSAALSIEKENNPQRIKMFYYLIRNTLLNAKNYFGEKSYKTFLKNYFRSCIYIFKSNVPYKALKIKTILRAIKDFKYKNFDYDAFTNRYKLYAQEKAIISAWGSEYIKNSIALCKEYKRNNDVKDFSIFTEFEYVPSNICTHKILANLKKPLDAKENFIFDFIGSSENFISCRSNSDMFNLEKNRLTEKQCFIKEEKPYLLPKEQCIDYILKFIDRLHKIYDLKNVVVVKNYLPLYSLNNSKLNLPNESEENKKINEFLEFLYNEFIYRVSQCHIIENLDYSFYEENEEKTSSFNNDKYVCDCLKVIFNNYSIKKEKKEINTLKRNYNNRNKKNL